MIGSSRFLSAGRYIVAALVAAGLQTAVLAHLVTGRAAILRDGAEVLLLSAPVDPRDLLRGEYVTLNYDISTVPEATLTGARPPASGRQILSVRLTKNPDGFWGVSESSFEELAAQPGSVVLKTQPFRYTPSLSEPDASMFVKYGIERYYVPEGEGRRLEDLRGTERLSAAVRVSPAGEAQIRALLLDGKPVHEEPLY